MAQGIDQSQILGLVLQEIFRRESEQRSGVSDIQNLLLKEELFRGRPQDREFTGTKELIGILEKAMKARTGAIETLGIDPTTADPAALKQLRSAQQAAIDPFIAILSVLSQSPQFGPEAELAGRLAQVLGTLDAKDPSASALQTAARVAMERSAKRGKGEPTKKTKEVTPSEIRFPGGTVSRGREGAPSQPGFLGVTGGPKGGFFGVGPIEQIMAQLGIPGSAITRETPKAEKKKPQPKKQTRQVPGFGEIPTEGEDPLLSALNFLFGSDVEARRKFFGVEGP